MPVRNSYFCVLILVFGLSASLLPACAKKPTDPNDQVKTQQKGQLILKPIGGPKIQADPSQTLTLKALATIVGVGPAANIEVDFALVGKGGGTLGLAKGETDSQGFITVPYICPPDQSATVQVQFTSTGAPSLTFTIDIGQQVVNASFVGKQPYIIQKNTTSILSLSVSNGHGAPLSNQFVSIAELGTQSAAGEQFYGDTQGVTDASGQIEFEFYSGTSDATYAVRATVEEATEADLNLIVADNVPVNQTCNFTSECPAGDVCTDGVCVDGARRCDEDEPCPTGWTCEANICVDTPVPVCPGGVCPPGVGLDVSGQWTTSYDFDLHDTLGVFADLGGPLGTIDTLFQGKLPVDIPVLGPIIETMMQELIKEYVPDWVPKLASALNDLEAAFGDMKVVGQMNLSGAGGTAARWRRSVAACDRAGAVVVPGPRIRSRLSGLRDGQHSARPKSWRRCHRRRDRRSVWWHDQRQHCDLHRSRRQHRLPNAPQ